MTWCFADRVRDTRPVSAEVVPFSRRPGEAVARIKPRLFAASQRTAFADHNLHIGKSRVVHAVAWSPWVEDLSLPVPACRQGFAGLGSRGELRPTRWPITCRRCRRAAGAHDQSSGDQGVLF